MKTIQNNLQFGESLGLSGKTAVITGGAVNIGRAITLRFASLGVKTVIIYNSSSSDALDLSKDINFSGGTAYLFKADISDEDEVEALFSKIEKDDRFGRVDIMVNNSGIFSMSEQTELSAAEWQRLFNVNTLGTFLCSREAARLMKRQELREQQKDRGVIINIASINALHPGFGKTVHYDASKGAVYTFTRSLAAELGVFGIRVNAVAPGLVDSEGLRNDAGPLAEMVEKRNPLVSAEGARALVTAENVADTVVYLASNLAAAVTGETAVVDRGYLLT